MIKDTRQWTRVTRPQIIEIQPGNLVALYFFDRACHTKDMLFQVLQRPRFESLSPEPARQRQQVEMSITLIRNWNVMQAITSREQRRVEGFAIEGDQRLRGCQEFGNRFEHGWLLRRI